MYIYQTLFLNGENSDIKICALGEEWNLHKVYLRQVGAAWRQQELRCPSQHLTSSPFTSRFPPMGARAEPTRSSGPRCHTNPLFF